MPTMPEGLEIDHRSRLNGLIAGYDEQVLICTGRDDWPSRCEDEESSAGEVTRALKALFGRGGRYAPGSGVGAGDRGSPSPPVISVLSASFPSSASTSSSKVEEATTGAGSQDATTSAYLFPSFRYIPRLSKDEVEEFTRRYLLPDGWKHRGDAPGEAITVQPHAVNSALEVQEVPDVTILICGHGGRDMRCGIMGPLLRTEFERQLGQQGFSVLQGAVPYAASPASIQGPEAGAPLTARVGLISHIGGHKFAGNVIIYLKGRKMKMPTPDQNPPQDLDGHGIWYGRVEPAHVEGIIRETVVKRNVITELFRGGITPDRKVLRI